MVHSVTMYLHLITNMISIRLKDEALQHFLRDVDRKTKTLKPLFIWMSGQLHKEVLRNFRFQSSPPDIFTEAPGNTRKAWQPLSDLTVKSRAASGMGSTGILQATGKLFGSIGKVRKIGSKSLEWGTPEAFAGAHHFKTIIRPKRTKYLAIPYPGVEGRPRDYENTFFAKRSMFQSQESGPPKLLFMLKDEVVNPARPFMTVSNTVIVRFQSAAAKYILGEFRL